MDRLLGISQGNLPSPAVVFAAVNRDSPGDARQPGLWILHRRELRTVAQHSHKRFLCGVFGVVVAAEDRMRDAVDQPRVLPDQRIEHLVWTARVVGAINRGRSAQDRLSYHHASALTHEDRLGAHCVQEFLEGERVAEGYLRRSVRLCGADTLVRRFGVRCVLRGRGESDVKIKISDKINDKTKINVRGGGQECPPHTGG